MRILQSPNASVPAPGQAAGDQYGQPLHPQGVGAPENSLPKPVAPSLERVASLEHIAASILEKLESIEKRIKALEMTRPAADPPIVPRLFPPTPAPLASRTVEPHASVTVDAEAVKKGLLTKMWKYLNDERSEKAV